MASLRTNEYMIRTLLGVSIYGVIVPNRKTSVPCMQVQPPLHFGSIANSSIVVADKFLKARELHIIIARFQPTNHVLDQL